MTPTNPSSTDMHPWHDIAPGRTPPELVNVVVETPSSSRNRYELDPRSGLFRLDRVLPPAAELPCESGFFPRTCAPDGDPLDALVLTASPTFPGCLIEARPVALLRLLDGEVRDDKVLCVPRADPETETYRDVADLPDHFLREIEAFLTAYRGVPAGRISPLGWDDVAAARGVIVDAIARYGVRERHGRVEELTGERLPRNLEL